MVYDIQAREGTALERSSYACYMYSSTLPQKYHWSYVQYCSYYASGRQLMRAQVRLRPPMHVWRMRGTSI